MMRNLALTIAVLFFGCGPDVVDGLFIGGYEASMEFARPVTSGFRNTLHAADFGFGLYAKIKETGEVTKIHELSAYGAPRLTYPQTPCKRCVIFVAEPVTFATGVTVVADLGREIVLTVKDFPATLLTFPESNDIRWIKLIAP